MTPKEALENLSLVSNEVGKRIPRWTQGAGGNVSVKNGDSLLIKASGQRLDSINPMSGISEVSLSSVRNLIKQLKTESDSDLAEKKYATALDHFSKTAEGRPRASMEVAFHAYLEGAWVIHFHSLVALQLARLAKSSANEFSALLAGENFSSHEIVERSTPGLSLTYKIKNPKAELIILDNHGVILNSDSPESLIRFRSLENKFMSGHPGQSLFPEDWSDFESKWKTQMGDYLTGKLLVYFPDTAVFFEKISKIIGNQKSLSFGQIKKFKEDGDTASVNCAEIWAATVLTQKLFPKVETWSDVEASKIANLPVEKLRQKGH